MRKEKREMKKAFIKIPLYCITAKPLLTFSLGIIPAGFLFRLNRSDLHSLQHLTWLVERTKEQTTKQYFQALKTMQAASYQGPVKIEFLKGVRLLSKHARWLSLTILGDPGAVSWVKRKWKWLSLQECPDRSFVLVNLAASTSF